MQYFLAMADEKIEITGKSPVTIGSIYGNCKIKLNDCYVSRHQCTIILNPDGDWLVDGDGFTPSRNGTQVNGLLLRCDNRLKEVGKGVQIYDKDLILVGITKIKFLKSELQSIEPWRETSGLDFK